eukprot:COSAG01_NODE_25698_length_736_cov_2.700157_1_plen_182_part_10
MKALWGVWYCKVHALLPAGASYWLSPARIAAPRAPLAAGRRRRLMLPSQASLLPLLASSTGLAHPAPQHATPTWAACATGTGRWSPLGNGSGAQLVREVSTGLCLAYPGTVPVSGWGPPLVLAGCNSSDAAQHWAFQGGELRYLGGHNTPAAARGPVCVQAFGKRPYDRPMPAACWPCVPHS